MTLPARLLCVPFLLAALAAQNVAVVPSICAGLPGNAAVSMPLRWSEGTMQVRIDSTLLPATFVGETITGLRLRKPSFLGEAAYASVSRTLTVRGGFHGSSARQVGGYLANNRPAGLVDLFGPAVVATTATGATGTATAVGEQLLEITFATPLPVVAGHLFLEFEASMAPMQVSADQWVDAVWLDDGVETGYAVAVGAGGCTTRSVPTRLTWVGATGPRVGGTAELRLAGAPPTVPNTPNVGFAVAWIGIDPQPRPVSGNFVGYGGSLAALDAGLLGCHQWAPFDATWGGLTDVAGTFALRFDLVAAATTLGMKIGVQAGWLDPARPGLPISVSNGVMLVLNDIGVGDDCSTVFFPGTATTSPWPPEIGLMPVLALLY